ncbi:chain length determinant protein [Marvinbryantia formatexigens DSM 14469]|uniref:Chain length determinant protein n=1 Tax=Marvinbryantia formatexigens DSM 14469 TaxID=478749 RepID=C6LDI9_9FIRM|nr:Wzz/FepE/Etk N-terminal domain-containing protein [Marvinbryantia formatexigens]EET61423.1 chain length determinant protein [Marvinbryantia formatexigens DSM 14469]UWO26093.1 Wzz/FepE/Etk N-terminal domain-containing protein [Marvinbryantia formatexigens DSM 14469]SDF90656.1 Capsular polysaccharide biosynthesis protein [Marvinbryantia formatexigens]
MELINNNPGLKNDEIRINLIELFYALLHKMKVIIFAVILGAAAAFTVTKILITPMYSSSSMIYIVGDSLDVSFLVNMEVGTALTADYQMIATSRPVVDQVIENLELDMTYENLEKAIEVTNTTDTHILKITVSDSDAERAKRIVDELTVILIDTAAEVMDSAKPNIIQNGYVSQYPDSPSIMKNTFLGALAGFIISCVSVISAFIMNDTINTEEDIEKYLGLNMLGVIPKSEKDDHIPDSGGKKTRKKKHQGASVCRLHLKN